MGLRSRAYVPTNNTASHDDHEKINTWVSISFLHGYEVPLGGPSVRRSSAIIHRGKKKMAAVYLSQCLANLTQPTRHKESEIFATFPPVLKTLSSLGFEDFITFLYVFMNVVKVFVR